MIRVSNRPRCRSIYLIRGSLDAHDVNPGGRHGNFWIRKDATNSCEQGARSSWGRFMDSASQVSLCLHMDVFSEGIPLRSINELK